MSITRQHFLRGAIAATALPLVNILPARAARRTIIKFGLDLTSDHPTTVNVTAAAKKIKDATNGDVEVQIFANSQLGDDTHMLSNLRSGAMQMMAIGDNILATLVPTCAGRQYRLRVQGRGDRVEGAGRQGRRTRAGRYCQDRATSDDAHLG